MRNLFTLGREGTTKLGSRAQGYKHALKLSSYPEKECGGWRRVLRSCDERERYKIEEEKRKKKITTRNISEINN